MEVGQFDARTAKALKAGDHLTFTTAPGLRLVATATRRTWTYRYKSPVDGSMRQVRIGSWPATSYAAALAEWEKLRERRDAGEDVAAQARAARAVRKREEAAARRAPTVLDVCTDWLAGHCERRLKPKGVAEARRTFDTMLGPIERDDAASISRSQAFDFIESYSATPVQAARLRQQLGAAWDYALDAGRLPGTTPNWWRLIMRGRLRSKGKRINGKHIGETKRVLSDAEAGELIRWLPNFPRVVEDVLTLYLWTLCRGSEILAMEGAEVGEEPTGLWWTIPRAKLKMERNPLTTDLRVPLVGRAEAVVRRRIERYGKGYLFPSSGQHPHVLQKTVQTAVYYHQPYSKTRSEHERPRLTVTHWAPHDVRRTGRTMLTSLGCPSEVGEVLLGHLPEGVEPIYNRYHYDPERRQWLATLAQHLEGLVLSASQSQR